MKKLLAKLHVVNLLLALLSMGCYQSFSQVLFYDTFQDPALSQWSQTQNWSVVDGQAYNDVDGSGGFLINNKSISSENYYLETEAGPFSPGYWREYFLEFGLIDSTGNPGYAIRIDATYNKIQLVKSTENIYYPEYLVSLDTALNDTIAYRFRIEHNTSGLIKVFVSPTGENLPSTPIISFVDTTYSELGYLGWLVSTQTASADFFVDYIQAGELNDTILCDDFNSSSISNLWRNDGSWSILNSSAYNNSYGEPLITKPGFSNPTYIIETTVSNLVTGYYRAYNLLFGIEDNNVNVGYNFKIDAYGSTNILSLGVNEGNVYYPRVLDSEPFPTDPTRPYTFKIEKYKNGLIQVYLDEGNGYGTIPILEATDTTHRELGQFGWRVITESVDEDFFVGNICATIPEVQKTMPQKIENDSILLAYYTRDLHDYKLANLTVGATHYIDRPYEITSLPAYLEGATLLKTANNDKQIATQKDVFYAYFSEPVVAYVAYDPRGSVLPAWLQSWTKTGDVIGSTDSGTRYFEVYRKNIFDSYFYTGTYSFATGSNLAPPAVGSNANYFIAFTPAPSTTIYEAELATVSGAKVVSNHTGFSGQGFADYINAANDYIEWNISIEAPNNYELKFRFANGSSSSRPLALSIDGNTVDTVDFYSSNSWDNWSTKGNLRSFLEDGQHQIRLTAIGSSGPNIDFLEILPTNIQTNLKATTHDSERVSSSSEGLSAIPTAYPNPGVNYFKISKPENKAGGIFSVYSLDGSRVFITNFNADDFVIEVNTASWSPGFYVYKIEQAGNVQMGKWIKQ